VDVWPDVNAGAKACVVSRTQNAVQSHILHSANAGKQHLYPETNWSIMIPFATNSMSNRGIVQAEMSKLDAC